MKRAFTVLAMLVAPTATLVACVGDDTVEAELAAFDAAGIDVTVQPSGEDGSVTPDADEDASDASVPIDAADAADAADALACTFDAGDAAIPGTLCSGTCRDLSADPSNCGACANVCEAGAVCSASSCDNVAGSLEGLEWLLPCTSGPGTSCSASNPANQMAVLSGATGVTYAVTLHFQGVVEQKTYTPNPYDAGPDAAPDAGPDYPVATGTNAGMFIDNASPNGDSYNIYELDISSPAQTVYLNAGVSGLDYVFPIDYVVTLPMAAGATVTLSANAVDGEEISNQQSDGGAVAFPGFFDGGAYDGQFVSMDVVSVTPQ